MLYLDSTCLQIDTQPNKKSVRRIFGKNCLIKILARLKKSGSLPRFSIFKVVKMLLLNRVYPKNRFTCTIDWICYLIRDHFLIDRKTSRHRLRRGDFLFRIPINIKGAVKFLRHNLSSIYYNVINQKYAKKKSRKISIHDLPTLLESWFIACKYLNNKNRKTATD